VTTYSASWLVYCRFCGEVAGWRLPPGGRGVLDETDVLAERMGVGAAKMEGKRRNAAVAERILRLCIMLLGLVNVSVRLLSSSRLFDERCC